MLKKALIGSSILMLLGSCSVLKPLGFTNSKQQESPSPDAGRKKVKFLENIDVNVESGAVMNEVQKPNENKRKKPDNTVFVNNNAVSESPYTGKTSLIQAKYALLLETEVEEVRNIKMFEFIDNWYGTSYRLGGTTKNGIDCSAFSQLLFSAVYGIKLPRTSKEQYDISEKISRSNLQEGDLIFFNTRGGVSHVGIYLQNNKFVHAATSGGVIISDFFDPYWNRKYVGVGRINLNRKSPGVTGVVKK